MSNLYSKGSVWRKWDLHIHTPASKGYKGDWVQFFDQIKGADCSVFGINDYFSVAGYRELVQAIERGEIDTGEKWFFPVVEMRMTDAVQNRHAANGATHFNFHIIFNNDKSIISITDIENFIKSLTSNGTLIGSDYDDKEKLSEKKVSFEDTLSRLDSDVKFKGNYLIWLPYSEYGGIDEIDPNSDGWIKRNFIKKSHILGSSNANQIDFFLWKSPIKADGVPKFSEEQFREWFGAKKPCIKGSDSHSADDVLGSLKDEDSKPTNKHCWVKADPTFNGIKQIVYEPELRVRIQESIPEDKAGYQVISKVIINSPEIFNREIFFNSNMNSVIGGRSTGKSVLLASTARKLKNSSPEISYDAKAKYDEFVNGVSSQIKVIWKDGIEDNGREIEFFPQGYMNALAVDKDKRKKLVQDILKQQGKDLILSRISAFKAENKKAISGLLNDYFNVCDQVSEKEAEVRDKGDSKGIETEIARLTEEMNKHAGQSISDHDREEYEAVKAIVEEISNKSLMISKDMERIEALKAIKPFKTGIESEISYLSSDLRSEFNEFFGKINSEANEKYFEFISGVSDGLCEKLNQLNLTKSSSEKNENYIKVSEANKNSDILSQLEKRIKEQKVKLFDVSSIAEQLKCLYEQRDSLKNEIIRLHSEYYTPIRQSIQDLSQINDGLRIEALVVFESERYNSIIRSAVNQRGEARKEFSNLNYVDHQGYILSISSLFDELVSGNLLLKGGHDHKTLAFSVLTDCFYSLDYELEYDGDKFDEMSDGKKAFVILKLLLDFSGKSCPILIDQPEDDLDNRAIYSDLVQYIKRKKSERQIIVVTHNPNIAVGADSELIIVANQHGTKNANQADKKFEYLAGSLEHSRIKDADCSHVLLSQGIREHVCAILEGGDVAFRLREQKYAIKN